MASNNEVDVKVTADTTNAKAKLTTLSGQIKSLGNLGDSVGSNAFSKIGTAAKNVASTVTKTLTAAITGVSTALVGVATSAVTAFADTEQLVGGIETIFGDSYDKLIEYANEAYQSCGLSANDYMEQATSYANALLQSLDNDTDAAAEYANLAMTDMADNVNKLGNDMESVENAYKGFSKENYAMLDNLKLGYGGTKSEMERLIDDANELAEAQGMAGDLTIDSYADVIEAIHLVQEELGYTGTTAEEAATTISGSAASAEAAWDNWVSALANYDLEGTMNTDLETLTEELVSSIETVVEVTVPAIESACEGIAEMLPETAGAIIEAVAPIIATLGETIAELLPEALQGAVDMAGPLLIDALEAMFDLAGDGVELAEDWLEIDLPDVPELDLGDWEDVCEDMQEAFDNLGVGLGNLIELAAECAPTVAALAASILVFNAAQTAAAVAAEIHRIQEENLNAVLKANPATLVVSLIAGLVAAFITAYVTCEDFRNAVNSVFSTIGTVISNVVSNIVYFAGEVASFFTSLSTLPASVGTAFQNIGSTIVSVFTGLGTTLANFVTTLLSFKVKVVKTAATVAVKFAKKLGEGFSDAWSDFKTFVSNMLSKAGNFASSLGDKAKEAGKAFKDKLSSKLDEAIEFVKKLPQRATDALGDLTGTLKQAGKDLIQGFIKGINSKLADVGDAVSGIASAAKSTIKDFLGISSPSRVFREIGAFTAEGFALGIEDGADAAGDAAALLGDAAVEACDDLMGGVDVELSTLRTVEGGELLAEAEDIVLTAELEVIGVDDALKEVEDAFAAVQVDAPAVDALLGTMEGGAPSIEVTIEGAPAGEVRNVTQNFDTKVVRSDSDLYTASTIMFRSAMREAGL